MLIETKGITELGLVFGNTWSVMAVVVSGILLMNPAAHPASLFPAALDRNHTPIIRPTTRVGASFVTTESPTGLRLNSPSSSMK